MALAHSLIIVTCCSIRNLSVARIAPNAQWRRLAENRYGLEQPRRSMELPAAAYGQTRAVTPPPVNLAYGNPKRKRTNALRSGIG